MTKGLTIAQEASFGQVVVVKFDNLYRKRPTLVSGTDKTEDRQHPLFLSSSMLDMYIHASRKRVQENGDEMQSGWAGVA